ncbi:Two-component system response regulator [Candidatus Trichorickettsia mobilis]|uniref:Two-component system response regulator n=1 Tax=Candidatus Trichorickettsia mobilis TaxID=1346319 RepID=A0ABZ0UQK9_9RICK|nr:winged helix-turn-helix domain-containing protein [Candidatus Trichorickettsia mobilis]WPY00334.1 Two-component system response regulator [Candidatus Trichorickettsia mobilis]
MSDKLPPKVLVIESDENLSASVCNTIERYWFNVERVYDATEAHKIATITMPNIIVISSRIKNNDALKVANNIRSIIRLSKLPLVFLIDESESAEHYQLADNNLVEIVHRPFTPNQLMIAIKSLLRKSQPIFQDKIIKYKDASMDLSTYKVFRRNKLIHLGPTEFKILQLFIQAPKTIYSREQIIDYVWGSDKIIELRTVDVHVNRLRSLMKLDKDEIPFIKTVRSSGYCLNLPGEID